MGLIAVSYLTFFERDLCFSISSIFFFNLLQQCQENDKQIGLTSIRKGFLFSEEGGNVS